MKRFIIGFLALADGELKMQEVYAKTPLDAYFKYLAENEDWIWDEGEEGKPETAEDAEDFVFNNDCYINYYEA